MKKQTLVVMGNGPSLKEVNFELLNNFDCFGLNSAYRAYERLNWWPKYHGCFDHVVTRSHSQNFKNLIEGKNPIERFFYLEDLSQSEKLQKINLLPFRSSNKWNNSEADFENFNDGGNSGINACQVGVCLGYKKIILVGVDCNYVEHISGVKETREGHLEVTEDLSENPNYWFGDYQQKGDKYNVPRAEKFHLIPWEEFSIKAKVKGIEIINCSSKTKLDCFPISTLEKEIAP